MLGSVEKEHNRAENAGADHPSDHPSDGGIRITAGNCKLHIAGWHGTLLIGG
jgi:hypothetical protein